MGEYVTAAGWVEYQKPASFFSVLNRLITGGWMNADAEMLDEDGGVMQADRPHVDFQQLKITIPFGIYYNLGRVVFFDASANGRMVMTCTDGSAMGWVQTSLTDVQETDLTDLFEDGIPKYPDTEEEYDLYNEGVNEAESLFLDTHVHD